MNLSRYQNIIIIVVVLIIAFGVYTYFFGQKEEAVLTETTIAAQSPEDQELIALLLELKSITLDQKIFSDAAFMSLSDFSKELVPEPVGRPNPFAPLGGTQRTGTTPGAGTAPAH